jgi:SAM-dependent methyltransferase
MSPALSSSSAVALKSKLVSQAIQDPLFKSALRDAASQINKLSLKAANEATVESAFERILYSVLKDIGVNFHPDKETPVKTKRHTAKGRTDSRIGAVVIEYKQPSTLASAADIAKATKQLTDYVSAISEDVGNEVIGFLTDGTKILEIRSVDGDIVSTSSLSKLDETTLLRLIRGVISLDRSALSSRNLIRDFCGDDYEGIIFKVARLLNDILAYRATIKTEMLRTEWEALFRLAHEDQSQQKRIQERRKLLSEIFEVDITEATMEYRALFALHTSYAIVLKFISFRVVSDVKFHTTLQDYKSLTTGSSDVLRAFCATLEDGELFRQIGILNLLEGDFFSWYADGRQWSSDIADGLREVLVTLSRYEDVKNIFDSKRAVDLFRSLYEATVPQVVRASFGEFYTPYWLADHVLETSRLKKDWTALDPCCGSGTFLIAAISRIRQEMDGSSSPEIAHTVLDRVFGIDLNPLAILTARIHYFIHIADLLEEDDSEIVIPVFLGDASNVPITVTDSGVEFLHYELKTLKTPLTINIPIYLAQDYKKFARIMFDFEKLVQDHSYKDAKQYLLDKADVYNHPKVVRIHIENLADELIGLERKEWNGIWARIIANFITTACIGPFTNIVGNPPWIDWKSLPAGYREKVKALCVSRGLFSGAGRTGGINLNVCALITHVAATNWLKKGGHLAFLMPRELANQASYEGWRRSVGGAHCSLIELHDWSDAGHPFDPVKEDFMTFLFRYRSKDQTSLPVYAYSRKNKKSKAHQWQYIDEAMENLERTPKKAGQVINGSTSYTIADNSKDLEVFKKIAGSCAYIAREGIEFYPQELLLFYYDAPGPRKGQVWVKNIQVQKSKYKIPQQRVLIETKYLFPLVKGPYIGSFRYDDPEILVAFPYDATNPHSPVDMKMLQKNSPLLLQYYKKWKDILEKQTSYSDSIRGHGEFYGVARTGPYSFKSCYVAFRDNTKWCATVITKKKMPWGEERRFVFQNHAVSICEKINKSDITESEAYYVAGIFNTKIVGRFIYASSDNRSFKIRPPVYVPDYDPKNSRHIEIARLAKLAAHATDSIDKYLSKIEVEYLSICDSRK